MTLATMAASAGEIILVDPLAGSVQTVPTPGSLPPRQPPNVDLDRARSRAGTGGEAGQIILVQPEELPGGLRRDGTPADARRDARRAIDRAGSLADPEGGVPSVLDDNAIVVIQNGQARVIKDGERVDNDTRAQIDVAKARSYAKGKKPCGSTVIVGGVGESGVPAGGVSARDVNVMDNCR